MESIVKVEGVSKHYGSVQALDDVSFEVRPGEIFGLIGPDDIKDTQHGIFKIQH
jgi:ABC-2 type transport system ATP-binding protein